MKEKIKEVLNGLEIENVDNTVDDIAKEVALFTVPKDKYNSLSDRLKNLETEKNDVQKELDELKTKSMTDEQKQAKAQADYEKKTKELSMELNKIKAKDIFKNANIPDEKIDELLEKVVSDDEKKTLDLANSFADILKVETDKTKKEVEEDILQQTKKPDAKTDGNGVKELTKEDFLKMSYSERKKLYFENQEQYNEFTK